VDRVDAFWIVVVAVVAVGLRPASPFRLEFLARLAHLTEVGKDERLLHQELVPDEDRRDGGDVGDVVAGVADVVAVVAVGDVAAAAAAVDDDSSEKRQKHI
jgi:hypothetical protein